MKHLILSSLLIFASAALATPMKLTSNGGTVEFFAITKPSFVKIHGIGQSASSDINIDGEKVAGTFEFDLATLDTGMAGRNDHMRDKYLQVKEFPKAKLEITGMDLKQPLKLGETTVSEAPFKGNLTLHGVTKPVTGTYSLEKSGDVNAKFSIQLSDYKIAQPSFMAITVRQDIDVQVKIAQLKVAK